MTPLSAHGSKQAVQDTLTRRSFLSGTARAVLGAAVVGAGSMVGLSACGKSSPNDAPDVLTVADSSVVTRDSFASIDDAAGYYKLVERGAFDAGTMMYTTGSKLAAALCAGKTANIGGCHNSALLDGIVQQCQCSGGAVCTASFQTHCL